MNLKKYQIYLSNLFLTKFILVSFVFFCIVIIVNFFEEIRFAEKYDTELYYIIYLSVCIHTHTYIYLILALIPFDLPLLFILILDSYTFIKFCTF